MSEGRCVRVRVLGDSDCVSVGLGERDFACALYCVVLCGGKGRREKGEEKGNREKGGGKGWENNGSDKKQRKQIRVKDKRN